MGPQLVRQFGLLAFCSCGIINSHVNDYLVGEKVQPWEYSCSDVHHRGMISNPLFSVTRARTLVSQSKPSQKRIPFFLFLSFVLLFSQNTLPRQPIPTFLAHRQRRNPNDRIGRKRRCHDSIVLCIDL